MSISHGGAIHPIAYGNENTMLELMKMSMITNMLGKLDTADNSLIDILIKLVIVLLINSSMKIISDMIIKFKSKFETLFEKKEFQLADFKYKILIDCMTYKRLMYIYMYSNKKIFAEESKIMLSRSKISDTYTLNKPLGGVEQNLFLVDSVQFIKFKKLGYNEYIYYYNGDNGTRMVVCNTCNKDLVDFLNEIHIEYHKTEIVYKPTCWIGEVEFKLQTQITFDNIFFEQKDEVMNILTKFKNGQWYVEKSLPYHLGLLLTGEPGTSKTSFIKALSSFIKRDIYVLDCLTLKTKNSFAEALKYYEDNILVMEDFDRIPCVLELMNSSEKKDPNEEEQLLNKIYSAYLKCEDKEEKKKLLQKYEQEKNKPDLDLAFILNKLDGIIETPGRMIIFTANFPERISKALLRPGRIDYVIEFKKTNRLIIGQILKNFFKLNELPDTSKIADYRYTHAQIYGICKKYDNLSLVLDALSKDLIDLSSVRI